MRSPVPASFRQTSPSFFISGGATSSSEDTLSFPNVDRHGRDRVGGVSRRSAEHHRLCHRASLERRRRQHPLLLRQEQATHQEGLLSMQQAQDQVRQRREGSVRQLRKAASP
jgi:hypothetical protein